MARLVVGVVGAGQLARMLYVAGTRLDIHLRVLARAEDESAAQVFADVEIGGPDDPAAMRRFARNCDVVTFDHELVDIGLLETLASEGHVLRPGPDALRIATDKGAQREVLGAAGLPLPPHARIATADDLAGFADEHGWPVVAKAVRGGYDGRGVWTVSSAADGERVLHDASAAGLLLFAEPRLELDRELAVLVARRPDGTTRAHPVVETVQVEGICHEVLAPADIPTEMEATATEIALHIAETIETVGMLAVEMFVVDGRVLINELAARPHNSGHLTLDGAATSQFENHLRAVCDLPLGPTHLLAPAVAMANVIATAATGDPRERLPDALAAGDVHVHLYGKTPRPGRKIGHVTATAGAIADARARARGAAEILAGGVMGGPRGEVPRATADDGSRR